MCEIVMLIIGIITLIRGRFLLNRAMEVRGWTARIIGLILVLPFPLSFFVGIVLGAIFLTAGKGVDGEEFKTTAQTAGFVIVVCCFLLAIALAVFFAVPVRKKGSRTNVADVPEDYNEPFQTQSRDAAESQDITGDTPQQSAPRDDRIQS